MAPEKYENLVIERYLISANMNTSYIDVGYMTPTERRIILNELKKQSDRLKEMKEARKHGYEQQ